MHLGDKTSHSLLCRTEYCTESLQGQGHSTVTLYLNISFFYFCLQSVTLVQTRHLVSPISKGNISISSNFITVSQCNCEPDHSLMQLLNVLWQSVSYSVALSFLDFHIHTIIKTIHCLLFVYTIFTFINYCLLTFPMKYLNDGSTNNFFASSALCHCYN